MLLDFAHVKEQRGQWTVELLGDRHSRLVERPGACRRRGGGGVECHCTAVDSFGGFAESLSLLCHIRCLTDAGPREG